MLFQIVVVLLSSFFISLAQPFNDDFPDSGNSFSQLSFGDSGFPDEWNLRQLYLAALPSVPLSCYQLDSCVRDQCPVPIILNTPGGICVPDVRCSLYNKVIMGASCHSYYATQLSKLFYRPFVATVNDIVEHKYNVFLLTDYCYYSGQAETFYGTLVDYDHFEKAIKNCAQLPLIGVFDLNDTSKLLRYGIIGGQSYFQKDIKVPSSIFSIAKSFEHTIFAQNCKINKAVCYNLIGGFPYFELYSCQPDCAIHVLQSYDLSWYMRWYMFVKSFFSLDTLQFYVSRLLRLLLSLLAETVRFAVNTVVSVLPSLTESLVDLFGDFVVSGFLDLALVALFAYSYGSLPLAVISICVFSYLRRAIYIWFNIS